MRLCPLPLTVALAETPRIAGSEWLNAGALGALIIGTFALIVWADFACPRCGLPFNARYDRSYYTPFWELWSVVRPRQQCAHCELPVGAVRTTAPEPDRDGRQTPPERDRYRRAWRRYRRLRRSVWIGPMLGGMAYFAAMPLIPWEPVGVAGSGASFAVLVALVAALIGGPSWALGRFTCPRCGARWHLPDAPECGQRCPSCGLVFGADQDPDTRSS